MKGSLARLFAVLAGISAVFIVGGVGLTIRSVLVMRQALANVTDETLVRVELSGQVNTDLFRGLSSALIYARTRDAAALETARTELTDATALTKQLGESEVGAVEYDDGDASFAALQQEREAVLSEMAPAMESLFTAVDARDEAATLAALATLDRVTPDIERLEEQTSAAVEATVDDARQTGSDSAQSVFVSLGAMLAILTVAITAALVIIQGQVVGPLTRLVRVTERVAAGALDEDLPAAARFEVGALQRAFGSMLAGLRSAQAQVAEHQRTLEARVMQRTADLARAVAQLEDSFAEREQLLDTVRQLASPVIPVAEGVLVVPLVGVIDSERAEAMQQALLESVQQQRARVVIMDVTGVPLIDTDVARTLLQASAAVQLLGARLMMVGLRPELAQTIVGLGLDLRAIETAADLQTGLRGILDRRRPAPQLQLARQAS